MEDTLPAAASARSKGDARDRRAAAAAAAVFATAAGTNVVRIPQAVVAGELLVSRLSCSLEELTTAATLAAAAAACAPTSVTAAVHAAATSAANAALASASGLDAPDLCLASSWKRIGHVPHSRGIRRLQRDLGALAVPVRGSLCRGRRVRRL